MAGELVHGAELDGSAGRLLRKSILAEAELCCEPHFAVERGPIAEKILEAAEQRKADVIVLGVRRPSGFPGATTHLPMATAHKVVTHAECPVLTVRGLALREFGLEGEKMYVYSRLLDHPLALDARIAIYRREAARDRISHWGIHGYPAQCVSRWRMKNGEKILFRPIWPDDEVARDEKLDEIVANILPENLAMHALANRFGFKIRASDDPTMVGAVSKLSDAAATASHGA